MHHFVPDFGTDDEYVHMTNSSALNLPRKSIMGEGDDDLMELLWHKGQVVVQNQRLTNTSPPKLQAPIPPPDQNLFIQEDEMTSWLRDDDFSSDLLSAATPSATEAVEKQMNTSQATAVKPPVRNFMNFSRLREDFSGRFESPPLISKPIVRESTVVIPTAPPSSTDVTESSAELNRKGKGVTTTAPETEILGTSSSVVSKSEIESEKAIKATECRSKETKRGSKKRSRAAEVHNLSERKRRDRINERMKTLQELIPRCNKTDKASMLEEAIEYMKSLQLQVKMMSMGCGMMPMMYPGIQQQYMAMGMGMSMNQPLPSSSFMPFPNMPLPAQTHLGGSGQHYPDQSRVFLPNQQYDPTLSQTQYLGYMDQYKQFHTLQQTQLPKFQNEATSYPSSSRVSSSKESEDQGNHTTS